VRSWEIDIGDFTSTERRAAGRNWICHQVSLFGAQKFTPRAGTLSQKRRYFPQTPVRRELGSRRSTFGTIGTFGTTGTNDLVEPSTGF
jgi:hypothetical protein